MKRKKMQLVISAMIFLIAMTGCPYNSKVPLSDPQKSVIDTTLLGRWVNMRTNNKGSKDTLAILKFNDHEYYIESLENKDGKLFIERARGFTTIIGNSKILNICTLDEPDKFYLERYDIVDNLMILASASDQFIKTAFSSTAEFYTFFKNNMGKEGFFEVADTIIKVK
jgi:hypothetical protein